ncbi:hypothetical protein FXO38_11062 [Capsicum annuum]|uniref:J domain-containing protein n=1 Tax=Capsicum annuum TaxID=4072 RepID=A0A2G2ZI95_CAPAN|nr:hypothetical protein FXO38_11062 [Capsicum annuum]PHT81641.1 hypothetical protein T459_14656 [Capsicum annuum]
MVAMIMSLMVKDPNMDEEGWHKNHLDKGGVPTKFKDLAQDYEVLSDPEKHEIYDQYDEDSLKEGIGGGGGGHNLFYIFSSFFGGSPFARDGGSSKGIRK